MRYDPKNLTPPQLNRLILNRIKQASIGDLMIWAKPVLGKKATSRRDGRIRLGSK